MKFLCDNCKAKYHIADEKVAGRTLRMKCRRCSHEIIIRGTQLGASSGGSGASRPSARPRGGGSSVGPAPRRRGVGSSVGPLPGGRVVNATPSRKPSALSADFRRQMQSPAEPPPQRLTALDQWHVAINDVPVGPIRREELGRKISAGAVNGDSLVWREGFDDWRPLKDVPELSALIRQRRVAPPPPKVPTRTGPRAPTGRPGSSRTPRRDETQRSGRSNVVSIGGRLAAAPAYEELDAFEEAEPTRVSDVGIEIDGASSRPDRTASSIGDMPAATASVPGTLQSLSQIPPGPAAAATTSSAGSVSAPLPFPSAPPAKERRRVTLSVPVMALMLGVIVFSATFAVLIATRMMSDKEEVAAAPEPTGPVEPSGPSGPDLILPEATEDEATEADTAEPSGEEGEERVATSKGSTRRRSSRSSREKQLTEEQRKLLERFGGSGTDLNLNVGDKNDDRSSGSGEGLNAQQLSSVVSRNRPQLGRCYEVAIRGMGDPPTVRLDVSITVGMSGRVSRVRASGNDVGGLKNCVQSSVKRWRFPSSGNTTETRFPLVFQPGG